MSSTITGAIIPGLIVALLNFVFTGFAQTKVNIEMGEKLIKTYNTQKK